MAESLPRVVIIGGGFGGLTAAQALAKAAGANHAGRSAKSSSVSAAALPGGHGGIESQRHCLADSPHSSPSAKCRGVAGRGPEHRPGAQDVALDEGSLAYDYLIVATGARHSYFGHDDWAPLAPGPEEHRRRAGDPPPRAVGLRDGRARDGPGPRHAWLTFVIVGGGPTGVELAGARCEIGHHALAKDFRRIDPKQARVILVEGSDRVLHRLCARAVREGSAATDRFGS